MSEPSRRRRSGRLLFAGLVLALAAAAALAGLGAINHRRLGGSDFERARRALLERARRVLELAGPSYQQEALAAIGPSPVNGRYFRFDDRLDEAVESALGPDREPEAGGPLLGLEFDDPEEVVVPPRFGRDRAQVAGGVLRTSLAWPAYLTHRREIELPLEAVGEIELRLRARKATQLVLAWNAPQHKPMMLFGQFSATFAVDLVPDGEFHTYRIDAKQALKRHTPPDAVIRRFFLAPNARGDRVEIDYFRVISKTEIYRGRGSGVTYEALGHDLRRALFTVGARRLEYRLTVPEAPARLRLALGVLNGAEPAAVRIAVAGGDREAEVLAREVVPGGGWQDAALDLSPWAEQEVTLALEARAAAEQVVLWANPLLYGPPRKRLNVVIYLEDTLRADHLSTFGYERPTSPVKDRLARGAVGFSRALAQATKTRPSIPSLLTSLPPSATGVWNFWERLADEYLTLAELLRHQGFTTAAFMQNGNAGSVAGLHQGYGRVLNEKLVSTRTERLIDERLERWLEEHADRNFFLYLHTLDPHGPYEPQAPFDEWHRELEGTGTAVDFDPRFDASTLRHPTREGRIARYDGEIRSNDLLFGRFLSWLDRLGLGSDTLLVFLSDHGEHLGERGYWEHRPPGYLPVLNVPLLIAYPAGFPGGLTVDRPVQLMDVMPTILELAGVDRGPLALAGESLVPLLRGEPLEGLADRVLVSEEPFAVPRDEKGLPCNCGSLFYRDRQLIRSLASGRRLSRGLLGLEVLDLSGAAPRGELGFRVDLATHHRFRRTMLEWQSTNIRAWRRFTSSADETVYMDPEVQERLRALGYLD